MLEFFMQYKYILVPISVWFGIQLFKVIYDRFETKKWHWSRIMGAGGMPSSHSAVVVSLATLIAKNQGLDSPLFALSATFAFIVMYDAAGVRRAVGKQAKVINDILNNQNLTAPEKLQEMTGHSPFQVSIGALIGLIAGLII